MAPNIFQSTYFVRSTTEAPAGNVTIIKISILVLRKKYDRKALQKLLAEMQFQSSYFVRSTTRRDKPQNY